MARTRTLLQMRTEARQRAGMENSTFVTDAEIDRFLNEGIAELYERMIVAAGQEYFLRDTTIAVVAGTSEYNLPTDFFICKGVDLEVGGQYYPVRPFMLDERRLYNVFTPRRWNWPRDVAYRLGGDFTAAGLDDGAYQPTIRFVPEPSGAANIVVWYLPHSPVLDGDTDVWDGFNGWEEYPVCYATIRMLAKEESDTSMELSRLQELRVRIDSVAPNRDASHGEVVQDLSGDTES